MLNCINTIINTKTINEKYWLVIAAMVTPVLRDIRRHLYLEGLKSTRDLSAQVETLSISLWRVTATMLGFSTRYILVSSAKRRILDPMSETMSLIKIRQSNGPNIDIYGTPEDKIFHRELAPGRTTRCCRPVK